MQALDKNQEIEGFEKALMPFIPDQAIPAVVAFIVKYNVHFTVSKKRKTKLGDYRHPHDGKPHRISVNGNLNPYAFLITTLHEMAHLLTYVRYENRVRPHGVEWKNAFKFISQPLIEKGVFPDDVSLALSNYLRNAKASSGADPRLYRVLSRYDENPQLRVEDLEFGTKFKLNGKIFVKGRKLRTRFECEEVYSQRRFRVLGVAQIEYIIEEKNEQ
ncbi:MAG: SprT-like domain-containing protein [Crocinitomicaceae bacterium]